MRIGILFCISSFIVLSCKWNYNNMIDVGRNASFREAKIVKTESEYRVHIEKNIDLLSAKEIGDFEFAIRYIPADLLALEEFEAMREPTSEDWDSLCNIYKSSQVILFSIKANRSQHEFLKQISSDYNEYQTNLHYYSFQIQKDIFLIEDGDTLVCDFIHMERTFDISPEIRMLLAFDASQQPTPTDKTILYDDTRLGLGPVKLTIAKQEIEQIPTLKLY